MKRIFIILLVLSPVITGNAQNVQSPSSRAYPTGIYIFCGSEIPRNFHYLVEKKGASGEYVKVAEVRAPQNAAGLKSNLLRLPSLLTAMMPPSTDLADFLWERQRRTSVVDSLYAYAYDPKIVAALGCGWFDEGIATEGAYQYRISKVSRTDAYVLGEITQRFPENTYRGTLATVRFVPGITHVTLNYRMSDTLRTHGVALYRSRLMEKNYQPTPSETSYTSLNGRMVAAVRDETVAKGMAYSYVAIPYDALGNMGTPSDTINVYNFNNMADIGILEEFKVTADKAKRGVLLTWKITTDSYIHGYEIFRSKNYDAGYQRIATLPADAASFFDDLVINYGDAYFYYMTVSNGFGANLPSARTPVILEGARENFMPPQNVEATLAGNVVTLTFESIDLDTRGYQIYRGEGFLGALTQIATISTRDTLVVFTDTLALSIDPQTISYAVADVNSSYNVSPLSERVSIQFGGGMLSAPSGVEAQMRGNEILVAWDDMTRQNAFIGGYNVYRSTVDSEGKEDEPLIVATLPYDANSYIDTQLTPGTHYRYALESIDLNGETSGLSLHAGIIVPAQPPLPPGQITAIAADNSILLRWDNPFDPSIKTIRVYRATLNARAALLKELPADQTAFEDQTAKPSEQYFYYVVTVNGRGEESRADEPVSGRIRGIAAQSEPVNTKKR